MSCHISVPFRSHETVLYTMLCYSTCLGMEDAPDFRIGPRTLDDYILVTVTKGVFHCEQHGQSYDLHRGEFIFIDLHRTHMYTFRKDVPTEIYWMHMNGDVIRKMAQDLDKLLPLPLTGRDETLLPAIRQALIYNDSRNPQIFEHSAHLIRVMTHLLKIAFQRRISQEYAPDEYRFRLQFEQVLAEHDLSTISLDGICQEMNLDKYYFSHRFQQIYGTSPMKFIMQERIGRAKNLLRYSSFKISNIASACGFSSPAYFATAFRRETGVSPEEYRRQPSPGAEETALQASP